MLKKSLCKMTWQYCPAPKVGEGMVKGSLSNPGAAQRKGYGYGAQKSFWRVTKEGEPQKPPAPAKHTHIHKIKLKIAWPFFFFLTLTLKGMRL